MSKLPMNPLFQAQQEKIWGQIYALMDKQVKSYHMHRHMGVNSSVPVELAQELMESIEYTVGFAGGILACENLEETLHLGQEILDNKRKEAVSMLALVSATAPRWQTECRWEAFRYLHSYLEQYDWQHLAHQGPEGLFYPILIAPPEGIRGIDSCLFYLRILWTENQIMAAVPENVLEAFWDRLPAATLNPCEQLLLNCMAKALLGSGLENLLLEPEEHARIQILLMHATEEELCARANLLYQRLSLSDENAKDYVHAVVSQLLCRIGDRAFDWSALFL